MWWCERRRTTGFLRLATVFALAGLTAGCFQPLYGKPSAAGADSVHDKLGEIVIAPIVARQGTPQSRVAVGMKNALEFDLNGNAGPTAPTHRLVVSVSPIELSVAIDQTSGRPTAQIGGVAASYQLIEIATGKVVLSDSAYSHVDYDIAGSQQRFTVQRAGHDAEDRAVQVVAETIRNRLASYFVAGT